MARIYKYPAAEPGEPPRCRSCGGPNPRFVYDRCETCYRRDQDEDERAGRAVKWIGTAIIVAAVILLLLIVNMFRGSCDAECEFTREMNQNYGRSNP